ncbi:chemotaxis protein CheW [Rhodoferax sp. U11-2br]|uniref:chemotaxis protein CheW n=1 Tax=Rhodoferax sp. U11-2br TaxID=2838878 RepID=UPI001BEB0A40|nr:chemotaxis protein CheW [Rhodoferax sp. U11-2br]MBT3068840.1 chemotaxis protein CheW [Rhodoferax sp. U11-2br]
MNKVAAVPQRTSDVTSLTSSSPDLDISEFLAFKLGEEEYGMDILRVQEIRSFERPTRMANAPEHILGVVNLRGVIVPIVDMRIKFQLNPVNYNTFTVVIVLNIGARVVGMVVDGVSDVITLSPEQLRPVPELSSAIGSDHLLAIGSLENRMLILIDIEKLMSSPEMRLVTQQLAN